MKPLFVSFLFFVLSSASHGLDLLDKAVAIVENDIILESELRRRLNHVYFLTPEARNEDQQELEERVLEQLIDEKLQQQLAKRANVTVSNQEIQAAMADFSRRLQASNQRVPDYLNALGITQAQVVERVRTDLSIQKIQQGSLSQRIRITAREIDQFLESKAGQEWLQPRFNVGHILLPFSQAPGDEEGLLAQASELHAQLEALDLDFRQAAQEVSKGPNAARGGDLGWNTPSTIPELFVQQLSNLKPGQLTPVFRSNAGFHILKLYQRSGAEPVFVERSKVRHILVTPTELFTNAEAEQKIDEIYQQLQNGADFIELAKEVTDDTASKLSGGDLDWSTPGQFVPAFEQVMNNTAVGEISEPFRSQFGWHILKIDDRRTEDMFENVKRNQVRNILRNQRLQDELQIWILELRERAFIQKIS